MIAVADNGASKCEWVIGETTNSPRKIVHRGFNPNTSSAIDEKEFRDAINIMVAKLPQIVFFYSAGVANKTGEDRIRNILKSCFPDSQIMIFTDLTGVGRAVFSGREGIAAILGTGANAGYYTGEEIAHQPLSLGFLLGDEGSGAYLGKEILRYYLSGTLPPDLTKHLERKIEQSRQEIIKQFYLHPSPQMLGNFLKYLEPYKGHPFLNNLAFESFKLFFRNIVSRVESNDCKRIGFCGSVAFHLQPILSQVAEKEGYQIEKTLQNPAPALYTYHLKQMPDKTL